MRIEKIRIENLNSLYGVHEIDLTKEEYQNTNLFLLWGKTGSGKTTVLDAITLALYGKTSRLKNVGTADNGNEIMSKGARSCSAEVTFKLDNIRYCAKWAQTYKPIKKTDLDGYKWYFYQLDENGNGVLLADSNKVSKVEEAILKVIKLSYDQFTRAVLLEQGGFSKFLNADIKQRAQILEQLTGTDIYTKISSKVFEREKKARTECDGLKFVLDQIHALKPEEVANYQKKLADIQADTAILDKEIIVLDAGIKWHEDCAKAKARSESVHQEQEAHLEKCRNFAPERAVFELGERAAQMEPSYNQLVQSRKNLQNAKDMLEMYTSQLPNAERIVADTANTIETTKTAVDNATRTLTESGPVFQKVRALQSEYRAMLNEKEENQKRFNKQEAEIKENSQKLKDAEDKIAHHKSRLQKASEFFENNAADEYLLSEYEAIELQMEKIAPMQKSLQAKEKSLKDADLELKRDLKELEQVQLKLETAEKNYQTVSEALKQAEVDYQNACDGSKLEDLQDHCNDLIKSKLLHAKVEDLRLELHQGCKCPLCGSLEHPDCTPLSSKVSEIEIKIGELQNRIQKIQKAKSVLDELAPKENERQRERDNTRRDVTISQNKVVQSQEKCAEKQSEYEICQTELNQVLGDYNQKIAKYGVQADLQNADAVCQELKKRSNRWQKSVEEQKKIEDELEIDLRTVKECQVRLEENQKQLAGIQSQIEQKSFILASKQAEIESLFGSKDVDAEEDKLKRAKKHADTEHQQAITAHHEAQTKLESLKATIVQCQSNVQTRSQEIESAQSAFTAALETQQFPDETSFKLALLPQSRLESLRKTAQMLDETTAVLRDRYKEALTAQNQLENQNVTDSSLEVLQTSKREAEEKRKSDHVEIGQITELLKQNQDDSDNYTKHSQLYEQAQNEHKRWFALNDYIGSKEGDKFRTFAQGLTFNILLRNANKYLREKKLMTRYELVRKSSTDQSLDFLVHDYDTGQTRPVNNLSGGEQFCLSLALALALSDMAGKTAAIESLFIDEGLGTLDDNTLDTALTLLKNLGDSRHNRLVGLITHVVRAHELVKTQIVVEKLGDSGCSRLIGPGCQSHCSSQNSPSDKKSASSKNTSGKKKSSSKKKASQSPSLF